MSELTAVELVIVAHACEDWAGRYYGGPFNFGRGDAVRYVAEGHLSRLPHDFATACAAVRAHIEAHPEVLDRRLTDTEQGEQQARRDAAAKAIDDQAGVAFKAGDYATALDLIDRAELESPTFHDWDGLREFVRTRMEEAGRESVRSA